MAKPPTTGNAGDLFTAFRDFSNIKPDPAPRRAFTLLLLQLTGQAMMGCGVSSSALGFLSSIERATIMAILNAYFDESGKHHEHPVVTLTAVCVSQPKLAEFDNAWNALLRQYGLRALHMVDAMKNKKLSPNLPAKTSEERIEAMKPFADCINRNLEYGLVQAIDVKGFYALSRGMRAGLGSPDDPYYIAFHRAILEMIDYIHPDDRISLVCDYDNATAWDCFRHWKGLRNSHDLIRKMTISLAFADDDYFPALQAADMVAYLARLEAARQFYGRQYSYKPLLDYLIDKRPSASTLRWGVMFADEALIRSIKTNKERLTELENKIRI